MMLLRKNYWVFLVLAFFFLAGAVACSSTPQKRSIGEVIDDSVISNKLKVKYVKDKLVKGFKINVDTWKGVVSLRGKVDNQEQINRAVEIAERHPGVREVKSYLVLKEMVEKSEKRSKNLKSSSKKSTETVIEEDVYDKESRGEGQVVKSGASKKEYNKREDIIVVEEEEPTVEEAEPVVEEKEPVVEEAEPAVETGETEVLEDADIDAPPGQIITD